MPVTMPDSAVSYYFTATKKADGSTYKSDTYNMALSGTPAPIGSSSSGCDAGFGAFALLAMAGGALVLRKKD